MCPASSHQTNVCNACCMSALFVIAASSPKSCLSFKHGACVRIKPVGLPRVSVRMSSFFHLSALLLLSRGPARCAYRYLCASPPWAGGRACALFIDCGQLLACAGLQSPPQQLHPLEAACCKTHVAASSLVVPRRMMLLCSLLGCWIGYFALVCVACL